MAKTFTAPFAQDPNTLHAVVTTACTGINSTTPTNTSLIASAGTNGALLTSLTAIPRGTVTASSLLVFSSLDSGVTKNLKASILMGAQTVSTTAQITATDFGICSEDNPIRLKAGEQLYVASQEAQAAGIVFESRWTDF